MTTRLIKLLPHSSFNSSLVLLLYFSSLVVSYNSTYNRG